MLPPVLELEDRKLLPEFLFITDLLGLEVVLLFTELDERVVPGDVLVVVVDLLL